MERQAVGARVHTPTHTLACTRTRRSGQCQPSSPLKLQCAQCSACSLLRRCPQAMEIDRIQESRALLLKEHSNALAITQRVRLRRKAVRPSAPTRADGRGGAGLFVCLFVCLIVCSFVCLFGCISVASTLSCAFVRVLDRSGSLRAGMALGGSGARRCLGGRCALSIVAHTPVPLGTAGRAQCCRGGCSKCAGWTR